MIVLCSRELKTADFLYNTKEYYNFLEEIREKIGD